jgi:hypothetical protein
MKIFFSVIVFWRWVDKKRPRLVTFAMPGWMPGISLHSEINPVYLRYETIINRVLHCVKGAYLPETLARQAL